MDPREFWTVLVPGGFAAAVALIWILERIVRNREPEWRVLFESCGIGLVALLILEAIDRWRAS